MSFRSLRVAMLVGALVIACSSSDDDDGCNVGERPCTTNAECEGFAPLDLSVLGPRLDERCFRSECVAEKCEATPVPGRVEDDRPGDCARPTCDEEGRLQRVADPFDAPSREGLAPCERRVCEPGLFGGLGPVTRPLPEGASCFAGAEQGICSAGRCVTEPIDEPEDAAADAGGDGSTDASDDAPADAGAD